MALKISSGKTLTSKIEADKRDASKVEADLKTYIDGTNGKDTLYGNAGDNYLYGGGDDDTLMGDPGADELHGSNGVDTADYSLSDKAVTVNLATESGKGGYAQGDRLVSIENVVGSNYNDRLYGDNYANELVGGRGSDTLNGRGGDDTLIGGVGDDILIGGAGEDELIGGSDTDTASYETARGSVMADLGAGIGAYGDAFGDTYSSIENLTGSAYTDWLWGDDKSNVIAGGDSTDYLYGRGGADTLRGEDGNDVLDGGEGADILDGGTGTDEADYSGSDSAVDVNLSGTSSGGTAQGDTYASVENARGSEFDDKFHGTSSSNEFWGEEGNDTFYGDGGSDTFNGGQGSDTANYYDSESAVNVYLTTGQGFSGDAHGDRYSSIENIVGSRAADNTLIGDDGDNRIVSHGLMFDRVEGGGGEDLIEARGRSFEIDAGAENDIIQVWDVEDTASWEAYSPGSSYSQSTIDGGDGIDTLDFGSATNWVNLGSGNLLVNDLGVTVYLMADYNGSERGMFTFDGMHLSGNTNSNGQLTGSTHTTTGDIWNIENVTGTQYNDQITGNNEDNVLSGEGGSDRLSGAGGNDTLIGGAGADELLGGEGIDTADYSGSNERVEVSLAEGSGPARGGHAEGDTLEEIENVVGSDYHDILVGGAGDNEINGGDGNDTIDGGGGNDLLIGGEGEDEFLFGAEFMFSDSRAVIQDFEIGVDKINLSHLAGLESWEDIAPLIEANGSAYYGNDDGTTTVAESYVLSYEDAQIVIRMQEHSSDTVAELSAEDFIFA